MTTRSGLLLVGLLALTIAVRATYLVQIRENPWFDTPAMDEAYHDEWAREIARGDWTARVPFYRAPFYPFLLGLAYRALGAEQPPYFWIRGLQLGLGATTPFLVLLLARRLAPRRPWVAWTAAFVTALDGMLFYFEADLLLESLLAPLATMALLLTLRAVETGSALRWGLVGSAFGVFAVTRPNVLLFLPIAAVAALLFREGRFTPRRPRLAAGMAFACGSALWILPVAAMNRIVGRDSTLIAWQGGMNFFLGNNPEANGWSATAPSVLGIDWWGGYRDAVRVAESARGRELRPAEISDYWFERGLEWWREEPGDALALLARKVVYFLSGVEFGNNRIDRLFFEEFAPAFEPALYVLYPLVPLALCGAILLWRSGPPGARLIVLWVLVYGASVVAFFVTGRYRVPLRPTLVILGVIGAAWLLEGLKRGDRRALAAIAGAALLGVAINLNPWISEYRPSQAQFYHSVALVHQGDGDLERALEWQLRAVRADSTYPEANLHLGTLYMELGRPSDAVTAFERERALDPVDGRNLASLGLSYLRLGRLDDADRTFASAESAGHRDAPSLYNHGICLERLGRVDEAAGRYRSAVQADSTFADAWVNLGVIAARAGRLDEAISCWQTALRHRPDHPRARDNLDRAKRMREGRRS